MMLGNQRSRPIRTDDGYVDYLYDNVGEVYSAKTYTSGGSPVAAENFGYLYDPAFNLSKQTNNATVTSSTLNNLNEVTSTTTPASLTYDSNGNRTSRTDTDTTTYGYDDENQLTSVAVGSSAKSEFVYDGLMRKRIARAGVSPRFFHTRYFGRWPHVIGQLECLSPPRKYPNRSFH